MSRSSAPRISRSAPVFVAVSLFAACASADISPTTAPAAATTPSQPAFSFVDARRAARLLAAAEAAAIDTRPVAKYLASHLPTAIHLDDECVRESAAELPVQFRPTECLRALFQRLGISDRKAALVYADAEDPLQATIVAYALLKAGHPNVLLLDGGFAAWQGSQPAPQAFPDIKAVVWKSPEPPVSPAASLADVQSAIATHEANLVDARPPQIFRGEGRLWSRNGHIPGATNLDWKTLVRPDNEALLKPAPEVAKLIQAAGLQKDDAAIVYCGTGREATLLYLALKYAQNFRNVRLYEGSWTEYQSRADLPIALGDDDGVIVKSDGDMRISGQPTRATLEDLAAQGVKLVVNCRTPGEARNVDFNEAAAAAALGMKYVEIPLGGTIGYQPADIEALHRVLTTNGPANAYLHCASGGRAANLWAAYLVRHRGLSIDQAVVRLRKANMLSRTGLERLLGEELHYR